MLLFWGAVELGDKLDNTDTLSEEFAFPHTSHAKESMAAPGLEPMILHTLNLAHYP